MGAHILYDQKLNCTEERCGLCLWLASMCPIYVTKGRGQQGRYAVDFTKSSCPNMVHFSYKNATESMEKSPCSNVPIICPLCAPGSPVVWKYSLEAHFQERHRLTSPSHFPCPVGQSKSEKYGMKTVWQGCFKKCKFYNSKGKQLATPCLTVSEAHQSWLPITPSTTHWDIDSIQDDRGNAYDGDINDNAGNIEDDDIDNEIEDNDFGFLVPSVPSPSHSRSPSPARLSQSSAHLSPSPAPSAIPPATPVLITTTSPTTALPLMLPIPPVTHTHQDLHFHISTSAVSTSSMTHMNTKGLQPPDLAPDNALVPADVRPC